MLASILLLQASVYLVALKPNIPTGLTFQMGGIFSNPHTDVKNFHELTALDIDKNTVDFSTLKGKVVLVTNVASK